MRLLLIEDDEVLANILVQSLTSLHYIVDLAEDGQLGWEYAQGTNYDLILMDVELPKLDGISLCQRLRSEGCAVPILLITAKDASGDRIRGLDAGADDYLIKPLDLGELQARVRALLRRKDHPLTPVLEVEGLRLDPNACQVTYEGKPLALTPKEYSLLELFLRHPEQVFSRGNIIEHLWTFDDPPQEESVKSHIKGLRQKLKAVGAVDWIENVYGLGYRLSPKVKSKENSPTVEQEFNQAMDKLWQQYQGLMAQRLEVLQQAAVALRKGNLSAQLQESASQAAHKLAGVLGMFEREKGTQLAHEIEEILQTEGDLQHTQKRQLLALIQSLEDSLGLTPKADLETPPPLPLNKGGYDSPREKDSRLLLNMLVVDDDPVFLLALRSMLEPWGIQMTGLDNPQPFWDMLPIVSPDLLILDVEMPLVSGLEICQAVRNNSQWQWLPILFLTARRDLETIQQIFAAGADDYIVKPVVSSELLTRIVNRWERTRWLQTFSCKDPLTGLKNQPHSSRELENILQQAKKDRSLFCFILLVAVQLSQINIQYGHPTGNQVLQQWSRIFQTIFGNGEVIGYWGNGEFVVGMPGLSKQETLCRLEELLIPLRKQIFTAPDAHRFQASCSVAVAEYPTDGLTLQSLYQTASTKLS